MNDSKITKIRVLQTLIEEIEFVREQMGEDYPHRGDLIAHKWQAAAILATLRKIDDELTQAMKTDDYSVFDRILSLLDSAPDMTHLPESLADAIYHIPEMQRLRAEIVKKVTLNIIKPFTSNDTELQQFMDHKANQINEAGYMNALELGDRLQKWDEDMQTMRALCLRGDKLDLFLMASFI